MDIPPTSPIYLVTVLSWDVSILRTDVDPWYSTISFCAPFHGPILVAFLVLVDRPDPKVLFRSSRVQDTLAILSLSSLKVVWA